jgi:hypothetical protein
MKKERTERKKKKFIEALREGRGIITYACQKIGISRKTYYDWYQNDSEFKMLADEVNDTTIDVVESKLLSAINEGNLTAIIFYLKTKGKKRGYVERTEHEVNTNPFQELMESVTDEED